MQGLSSSKSFQLFVHYAYVFIMPGTFYRDKFRCLTKSHLKTEDVLVANVFSSRANGSSLLGANWVSWVVCCKQKGVAFHTAPHSTKSRFDVACQGPRCCQGVERNRMVSRSWVLISISLHCGIPPVVSCSQMTRGWLCSLAQSWYKHYGKHGSTLSVVQNSALSCRCVFAWLFVNGLF